MGKGTDKQPRLLGEMGTDKHLRLLGGVGRGWCLFLDGGARLDGKQLLFVYLKK